MRNHRIIIGNVVECVAVTARYWMLWRFPLVRTTLSVLTTFPIFYAMCMRKHRIIIGNVAVTARYWMLWRFPHMADAPLRPWFANQRWSTNKEQLRCWQRGVTGYPLVDAAMRQLWSWGWCPNYMRHIGKNWHNILHSI